MRSLRQNILTPGLGHEPRILEQIADDLRNLRKEVREITEWLHGHAKEYYTVAEVAALVQRSPYTVRRWLKEGRIEGIKISDRPDDDRSVNKGQYLIAKEQLEILVGQGKGVNIKISNTATSI